MATEIETKINWPDLFTAERKNFDSMLTKFVVASNQLESNKNAIKLLLVQFQSRADGLAKLNTEQGNTISNEYLGIISDIQHSVDLSVSIG